MSETYMYMWEYIVDPAAAADFEAMYGGSGAWVALFRRADGYVRTDLYRDLGNPARYVTVDRWASKAHRDRFVEQHAGEFRSIDRAGERLTVSETFLGEFTAR